MSIPFSYDTFTINPKKFGIFSLTFGFEIYNLDKLHLMMSLARTKKIYHFMWDERKQRTMKRKINERFCSGDYGFTLVKHQSIWRIFRELEIYIKTLKLGHHIYHQQCTNWSLVNELALICSLATMNSNFYEIYTTNISMEAMDETMIILHLLLLIIASIMHYYHRFQQRSARNMKQWV